MEVTELRIVRFAVHNRVKYGAVDENTVHGLRGKPFTTFKGRSSSFTLDGSVYKLQEVRLLAPCSPSKIVCLGLNYHSHAIETSLPLPNLPLIFLKPPTSVIGPDDNIVLPRDSRRVDYEGELAVVIGKKAKDVPEKKAKEYILGYTCFNDVSERFAQREDGQWTRAKGYDTFAPTGPWVETDIDPDDLKLETYLNGDLRQSARTSDLIFGVSKLVKFISEVMTLLPGDIIATGTPSGIGPMNAGDVVEVKIEKMGTLINFVVRQKC
jgi:2-keto-4-pentenoate hydratase/2-oxohepta-3-ene-1,7-dioic acid hydratase in catechol pathway